VGKILLNESHENRNGSSAGKSYELIWDDLTKNSSAALYCNFVVAGHPVGRLSRLGRESFLRNCPLGKGGKETVKGVAGKREKVAPGKKGCVGSFFDNGSIIVRTLLFEIPSFEKP
jgi:hypothetical protein